MKYSWNCDGSREEIEEDDMNVSEAYFVRVQIVKLSDLKVVCVKTSDFLPRADTNKIYAKISLDKGF